LLVEAVLPPLLAAEFVVAVVAYLLTSPNTGLIWLMSPVRAATTSLPVSTGSLSPYCLNFAGSFQISGFALVGAPCSEPGV
jgi:hypothetical protein